MGENSKESRGVSFNSKIPTGNDGKAERRLFEGFTTISTRPSVLIAYSIQRGAPDAKICQIVRQ